MGETSTFFGIDLGTTCSSVAYVDGGGQPVMVRHSLTNEETIPSVVYFENADNVVVGRAARDMAEFCPDRVVSLVKRSMGQERCWEFDGVAYTPESISALILRQLAQETALCTRAEVTDVVITVPAYFGMLEREATRNAGRIAGLNVLGIVPEPVAAALEYEVDTTAGCRTILVFDLGGGTFDTTVIQVRPEAVEVVCTDGDQQLGGADWDARLADHLLERFVAQAGPAQDPADDEQFVRELARTAEEVKRSLSQVERRSVPLRFASWTAMIDLTRATFEELTEDLVDRTVDYTRRTLATLRAKRPNTTIDEVLLVGGSSRMPMIAKRLRDEFGWTARLHDPELAVAKGAARFALSKSRWNWTDQGPDQGPDQPAAPPTAPSGQGTRRVTNVLPKAFGVKLVDTEREDWSDNLDQCSYVYHLVHANEELPSGPRRLEAQTTVDHQSAVEVIVYEQAGSVESPALGDNSPVDRGAGRITGLPPLPAGSPVEITMEVSDEGRLSVHAVEPSTGRDLTIDIRVSVLSEEQVVAAAAVISALTVRA